MTSEGIVVEEVAHYFSKPRFQKFSVSTEWPIQMGCDNRRADVVLLDKKSNLAAIAECKGNDFIGHGVDQLKSYLSATDTPFGLFANSTNPESWSFYENLGRNRFREITSSDFERRVSGGLIAKMLSVFSGRFQRPPSELPSGTSDGRPASSLHQDRTFSAVEGSQPMHNANGREPYYSEQNGFHWAANHCGLVSCLPQHIQRIIQDGELKKKRELASNGDAESAIDRLRVERDEHKEQKLILEREFSEKRQEADRKEVELARLRVESEKPTSAELDPPVDPPHNDGPAKQNISWTHLITGGIATFCGALLAFYLLCFYASAIDKAFFLDVDEQVESGTYAGLNDIVNPSALENALEGNLNLITILAPFIFLAFAVAVHHFWEHRQYWIVALLLVVTLLFDGILAVQISQKIHQANVRMGLGKGEWDFGIVSLVTDPIANLDIWTVIFCGFVTSVLVSIVYHVAVARLNDMRWPTTEAKQWAKNEKESRRRLQVTIDIEKNQQQQKLIVLDAEIQNLHKEIAQLEVKIASRQADIEKAQTEIEGRSIQAKGVKMADRDNMESQVNQFLNGWLRYVAHSGVGDSQIEEAKTVARNTLNQYYEG